MKIGVTGGYGSGKSSVSRVLASRMGAGWISSDDVCRQLLEPGGSALDSLEKLHGKRFVGENGRLDREKLRRAVFHEPTVKKELEDILHPLVRKEVSDFAVVCKSCGKALVVEVPLLFEVGWNADFDVTLLVRASLNVAVARAMLRDNIQKEEAERIIALQMPMEEKELLADLIVDNNGTFVSSVQQTAWFAMVLQEKKV